MTPLRKALPVSPHYANMACRRSGISMNTASVPCTCNFIMHMRMHACSMLCALGMPLPAQVPGGPAAQKFGGGITLAMSCAAWPAAVWLLCRPTQLTRTPAMSVLLHDDQHVNHVQVPGGWAAQRFGGGMTLALSFVAWPAAVWLTPTSGSHTGGLILARVGVGAAQGFVIPSIHTVLAQVHLQSPAVYWHSGARCGVACAHVWQPHERPDSSSGCGGRRPGFVTPHSHRAGPGVRTPLGEQVCLAVAWCCCLRSQACMSCSCPACMAPAV